MIPFAPWLPDLPISLPDKCNDIENVTPFEVAYKPTRKVSPTTPALALDPNEAETFLSLDGAVVNVVGTATGLFIYDSVANLWTNVTRAVGGAYAVPAGNRWSFAQYQNYIFATNGFDTVQRYQIGVSSTFENRVEIPIGKYLATSRLFVIMAHLATNGREMAWCALGDPSDWTFSAATLADHQIISDKGDITGISSGDLVVIIQRDGINRMVFAGPPLVFNIERFSTNVGCFVDGSFTQYGDLLFFLSTSGFKMLRAGQELDNIGDLKVDAWIERNLNFTNHGLSNATVDIANKLYVFNMPSSGSDICDTQVVYHWPTGRWSKWRQDLSLVCTLTSGVTYTLDNIDGVFGANLDAMDISLDSPILSTIGLTAMAGFPNTGADAKKMGFFTGVVLAAVLETGDINFIPGRRALLRNIFPLVESTGTLLLSVTPSVRNSLYVPSIPQAAGTLIGYRKVPLRAAGRFHRMRVGIEEGVEWQFAIGLDEPTISQEAA